MDGGRWLVRFTERRQADLTLYCLPFAGGTAAFFRPWANLLPPWVDLCAVQPPGRQDRWQEAPHVALAPFVAELADRLATDLSGRPYALFGHSLGGLLAFETARELRRRGLPQAELLGVSARGAPHLPAPRDRLHLLPDEGLAAALVAIGGIPEEIRRESDLLAFLLPTVRADLTLSETYQYQEEPPLACPLSVFGGDADPLAAPDALHQWRRHSDGPVQIHLYPGHHFYISDFLTAVVGALATDLSGTALSWARRGQASHSHRRVG
ncbi:thioesterase [Streptosporangiaceae bacterium NEAU-GS5]|nr:thioesterase [Streptosporangiaceae bacterium NEAU-GS5]